MRARYTLMAGLMNVLEACRRVEVWGLRGPGLCQPLPEWVQSLQWRRLGRGLSPLGVGCTG